MADMERSVIVEGTPCKVTVHQRSEAVWVVTGDYRGVQMETQDRTPDAALKRWAEAATMRSGDAQK